MLLCFMAAEIVCRIFYGVSVLITKLWREYPHDEEKSEKSEKCLREIKSVSWWKASFLDIVLRMKTFLRSMAYPYCIHISDIKMLKSP